MKILLANNYHYVRGGSERAYFDTARILIEQGHEVAFFSTKNLKNQPTSWSKYFVYAPDFSDPAISLIEKIKIIARIFYNFEAKKNLEKLIKDFQPDIAHLHNIYHHLSPSIIGVLKKNKIPTVMTLHDYKLVSPNYNLFVRGKIWEGSKPDKYWRCFTDRCLKDSYAKSFVAAGENYFHHWLKIYEKIDAFISPSRFLINKFKEFNFKKEIFYLPNPIFKEEMSGEPFERGKYILYYGRLSEEKGAKDLLAAYSRLNANADLIFVGEGPLKNEMEEQAKKLKNKIIFTGRLEGEKLWSLVRGAEFIAVPSKWYENAPYTIIEPMALGKIVLAADCGGAKELIQDGKNGFLFPLGDVDALAGRMKYILEHQELKEVIAPAAIFSAQKNEPEQYYHSLFEIYKKAILK